MADAQDALSALLSNPEALSKAMDIAKTFMASPPQEAQPTAMPQAPAPQPNPGAEPPAPQAPIPLPKPTGGAAQDDNTRLILALKPFLSEKRSKNVGAVLALMRAMQLMGAADLFDWRGH